MTVGSFICIFVLIGISIIVIFSGIATNEPIVCIIGVIFLIVAIMGGFELKTSRLNNSIDTKYIPAEPLAHNQTQTVFTTDEGTYLADGLYPDGTYLLTVDDKDVLVVWQAVDGEVG